MTNKMSYKHFVVIIIITVSQYKKFNILISKNLFRSLQNLYSEIVNSNDYLLPFEINAMRFASVKSTRQSARQVLQPPFTSSHLTLPQRTISLDIAHDFDNLGPVRLTPVKAFVGPFVCPMTGNYKRIQRERDADTQRLSYTYTINCKSDVYTITQVTE